MGRPTLAESRDTRTELLDVAMELLQTVGFNTFSYQDLADRLEIKKASIHYHFPSKEELGIALMDRSYERFTGWSESTGSLDLPVFEKLETYFDYFSKVAKAGTRICPCGRLMSEWAAISPALQKVVTRQINAHREWLKKLLEKGHKSGEIAKVGTVDEQAQYIFATIQGALQAARTQNNPEYFRALTKQIANGLKA